MVAKEPETSPEDGAYIWGLFIEGCRFNYDKMLLDESEPKILFSKCPIIYLEPAKTENLKTEGTYICPTYKTSERKGILSTTGHSTNYVIDVRIPTDRPQSHWTKRGVACLTQLND